MLIPQGNFVVIRQDAQEEKSSGGLYLPDKSHRGPSLRGRVLAVGPGLYQNGSLIPTTVLVNDRVVFSEFARLEQIGPDLVAVREHEIVAVLRD